VNNVTNDLFHQLDALKQAATQITGLDDFGPENYLEPLKLLLADLDRACLSEIGIEAVKGEIVGCLAGRLMAYEGLRKYTDVLTAPIEKPLIIIGLPRTGTTVLQRLIASDPNMQSLPTWLAMFPMPRPPRDTWHDNVFFQLVDRALEEFDKVRPEFRKIHPFAAASPDECRYMIDQTFWATTLAAGYDAPNYLSWVLEADATYVYEYHRKMLGLIGYQDPRRWMLKDPIHMFNVDKLLACYPDACIVQTHRDPLEALASVINLIWLRRYPNEPRLTKEKLGEELMAFWGAGMHRMERARRKADGKHFLDVHISESRADSLAVVKKIYDYFELPVSTEAMEAWKERIAEDPNAGHGKHHFKPEEFGITRERVNACIGDYLERYQSVVEGCPTAKNSGRAD
jgi:Sulfotransferase family